MERAAGNLKYENPGNQRMLVVPAARSSILTVSLTFRNNVLGSFIPHFTNGIWKSITADACEFAI